MTAPVLEVRIDFDDSGTFGSTTEDVTAYVLGAIEVRRGRDQVRALAPPMSPVLALTLDNADGRFWPDLATSPLYPTVREQHNIRIRATHSAVTYDLFHGLITEWQPDLVTERVYVAAQGGNLAFLGTQITTELLSGARTGDAIDAILDEFGWAGGRAIDTGSTVMPWWWETNADPWAALLRVVACEGPPARIDIAADGTFIFEDRHHRLLNSATSAVTLRDTGTEPVMTLPYLPEIGWDSVVNDVSIPVELLGIDVSQAVGTWTGNVALAAFGGTDTITVQLDTPCDSVDVAATVTHVGVGTVTGLVTQTKAQTVTVLLTSSLAATVTQVVITGRPLVVTEQVTVTSTDATSVTQYGSRGIPGGLDAPFLDTGSAQAVADTYVAHYKNPLSRVAVTVDGVTDTRLTHQLGRDVSDRVTVVASEPGVNDDFHIEQVGQRFDLPTPWTTTVFGLEEAPAPLVAANQVFIIGDATQGKIGTGKLGA